MPQAYQRTVEAEQVKLNVCGPLPGGQWLASNNPFDAIEMHRTSIWKSHRPMVWTLRGWVPVEPGDYIIKSENGSFEVMRPSDFERLFTPAP